MEIANVATLIGNSTPQVSSATLERQIDGMFFEALLKSSNFFTDVSQGEAGVVWGGFLLSELAKELASHQKLGFGQMILLEGRYD